MASRFSNSSLFNTRMIASTCFAVREGRASMGFTIELSGGRIFPSSAWVLSNRTGSSIWPRVSSSAIITPGPPASVRMQTRFPESRPLAALITQATSIMEPRPVTLMMPAFSNRACTAVSLVAIAPVWLAAAREPAEVAPDLIPIKTQPFLPRLLA